MAKIVGISGSLRKGSYNSALLRAAAEGAPDGCSVDIASINGIPLYDGDEEDVSGIPAVVAGLKDKIASADGLLLVTPEYNGSIPGVLKNAIDWLTRPPEDISRVFANRPVGIMGATPGQVGTRFSQTAWLPVFRALGMRAWFGKQLYVSGAAGLFDGSGKLTDERTRSRLEAYMSGFTEFVKK
jgi:NAD(P)H-dependent FMN reductase